MSPHLKHLLQKTSYCNLFLLFFAFSFFTNGQGRPKQKTATLKILTHNVYGVNKNDCAARGKAFGNAVAAAQPAYNIVGLQEYYNVTDADIGSCDRGHLTNAIWSTGRYKNSNNYYRHYPEVSWHPDGGVSLFTLHPVRRFGHWRWSNDNQGRLEAAEGFIFARIEIPFTTVYVDVYVVHVNSGANERERRKSQLQQIARKMTDNKSIYPVIVMGDFNIGGPPSPAGNDGYEDIKQILKNPRDLWLEAHPGEEGFTYDCVNNNAARDQGCTYRERIDFIFLVEHESFTRNLFKVTLPYPDRIKVVKWQIHNERNRFVSDHYGLEATIKITDKRVHR